MTVAVFFGGKSCEHNISIITGIQAMAVLKSRHTVVPVYIDNDGKFFTGSGLTTLDAFKSENKKDKRYKKMPVTLTPSSNYLYSTKGKAICKINVALLATHGYGGEDGCLQGLLSLCGIPFTGSGVLASSSGMDKSVMKKLFIFDKLPVLPYISFTKREYRSELYAIVERIKRELVFPLIVKPAGGGSSIGIGVAKDFPQLFERISAGFKWDARVVVENALENFTEYNCAVLGEGDNLIVSEIEKPFSSGEILTYKDKYLSGNKGKRENGSVNSAKQSSKIGQASAKREFPAKIDKELDLKIKSLAKLAFSSIGASGVARIDFLYSSSGELFINEINTIPGALSNYMFTKGDNKLAFSDLLEKMLDIALEIKRERDALKYIYESGYVL
ncbi:MAG: hypothetical protein FWE13_00015 [Firmicutes bacterium]|nr:hypothetical protein [Bacillota bacterium]